MSLDLATSRSVKTELVASDGSQSGCPICDTRGAPVFKSLSDRKFDRPGTFDVVRCPACGFVFTDPRLAPDKLAAHYPDTYHAPIGDVKPKRLEQWLEKLALRRLMRDAYATISARDPERLLDVGCGSGHLAHEFKMLGWDTYGIEPSPHAADAARRRGVRIHVGTLDDAPWSNAEFDVVLLTDSLEHIHRPVDALRRVRDLLHPGGLVGVTVPNFASWQRRAFGRYWWHLDVPRHLHHFDRQTLWEAVSASGLEPVEVKSTSHLLGLPGSLQYVVFGHCINRGVRSAQAVMVALTPVLRVADAFGGGDRLHLVARKPGS